MLRTNYDEVKDDFYEQLQTISKVPLHDMLLIMGDLIAKVGDHDDNIGRERVMSKHGCGTRNDNGERLVDFWLNNCTIGYTIFLHKNIHKLTWKSPDGKATNQSDQMEKVPAQCKSIQEKQWVR